MGFSSRPISPFHIPLHNPFFSPSHGVSYNTRGSLPDSRFRNPPDTRGRKGFQVFAGVVEWVERANCRLEVDSRLPVASVVVVETVPGR